MPQPERSPFGSIQRRVVLAVGLVVFVALVAYADRAGYRDAAGDDVGLLDAFYDASVLITLTARQLNPAATIASAVREEENAHLLRQGGADSVITSSGSAGRLLGLAIETPRLVTVLEDLLSVGEGLDIVEKTVSSEEAGRKLGDFDQTKLALAVIRDDDLLRFDDPRAGRLQVGDRVVCLCNQDTPK